jgi:2-hydroxycyclohexanecarboxyl-CoA dehydrogenase
VLTPSIVGGTEFYERLMADPIAGRLFGKAEQKAELGLVNMTDLVEVAVFLASPAVSKMTGQALNVTRGNIRALRAGTPRTGSSARPRATSRLS